MKKLCYNGLEIFKILGKSMKKFFKILFLLFAMSSYSLFAEDWFVCLGSYTNVSDAEACVLVFQNLGISAYVKELGTNNGTTQYRVFYNEKIETQDTALLMRKAILNSIGALEENSLINENDIWISSIEQTRFIAHPEKRRLTIKDSTTGNPIDNAEVKIDRRWNLLSDDYGVVPLPAEIPDGNHIILVIKGEEYIPLESSFVLTSGEITSIPQYSIVKKVDFDRIQIVLEWGEYPSDLDSHILSSNHHVYYGRKVSGNLDLDVDDTTSYGPETVTIRDPSENDVYRYYVHNYSSKDYTSDSGLSNSSAKITLIIGNEIAGVFNVTPNQQGVWWHVFDIKNKNQIVVVDEVTRTRGSN